MWTLILAVPATLAALAALVRVIEPRFAFFPMSGEDVTPRDFHVPCEPLTIETHDGERLRGWWMAGSGVRARILYFHGNGGNLSVWAPIVTAIAPHGYAVLAVDYRGYGLSTGRPTERGLYRDVEAVVERFWRDSSSDVPMLYWGRSLGVAMASYAATIRRPDGVILESGFPDGPSLARDLPLLLRFLALFSTYRFPSSVFLNRLDAPVPALVVHGDNDHVVPIRQGQALFRAISGPKQFVTIRGGDHNDVKPADPETYWRAVSGFIESLAGDRRRDGLLPR